MNEPQKQPEITLPQAFDVIAQALAHPGLVLNHEQHNLVWTCFFKAKEAKVVAAEPNLTIAAPANTTS